MSIFLCKKCGDQLLKFKGGKRAAKLVVATENKKGEWVEVINKKPEEGVGKKEKIFYKCLNCDFLNELPENNTKNEK